MSGITSQGPGFMMFAPPPSLSMEEMAIREMLVDQTGRVPPLNRIPTAKKAAAITLGLTLSPVLAVLGAQNLSGAKMFFSQLFGNQGEVMQKRSIEDLENLVFSPDLPNNPGLIEFIESQDMNIDTIRRNIIKKVSTIGAMAAPPEFMEQTSAQLEDWRNQIREQIQLDIIEFNKQGLTEAAIIESIAKRLEDSNIDPEKLALDVPGYIKWVLTGLEQPGFAANPATGSDATMPGAEVESEFLKAMLRERDRRKRVDNNLGLKTGQKAQMLDNIERSPDQWLARVQAQRQALFARPIPKTPLEMRDQGLVQQVYYSTRVQQ